MTEDNQSCDHFRDNKVTKGDCGIKHAPIYESTICNISHLEKSQSCFNTEIKLTNIIFKEMAITFCLAFLHFERI